MSSVVSHLFAAFSPLLPLRRWFAPLCSQDLIIVTVYSLEAPNTWLISYSEYKTMLLVLSWEHEEEIMPLLFYPLFTGSLSIPAFNIKSALLHILPSLTLALSIFLIFFSYTIPLVHSVLLLTAESYQSPLHTLQKLLVSAGLPSKAPSAGTAYPIKFAILKPPFHFGLPWKPTSLNRLRFSYYLSAITNIQGSVCVFERHDKLYLI